MAKHIGQATIEAKLLVQIAGEEPTQIGTIQIGLEVGATVGTEAVTHVVNTPSLTE